jgi:SAM-dependent methyltransferase
MHEKVVHWIPSEAGAEFGAGAQPSEIEQAESALHVTWWETFFDAQYVRLWESAEASGNADRQAAGLISILGLQPGSSVLDAPCGYGRISKVLAQSGVHVLGVAASGDMLEEAERRRGDLPSDQLRYLRHDLRTPLAESSVFIETNHRGRHVANIALGRSGANRLPDDTLLLVEDRFQPVTGRVETNWFWSGPAGSGQKSSSMRVYAVTELVRLVKAAGLRLVSVHRGCFPEPFVADNSAIGNRLGLLAAREE